MMLNLFPKTESLWLEGNEELYVLKLFNVADPLEPKPLWDHQYSGNKEITDASGRQNRRLKEALSAHRRSVQGRNKQGWLVEEQKVFGDLIVRIPSVWWNRDIRSGGKRIEILSDNLARLVEQDLGRDLIPGRPPVCAVMPDPGIEKDDRVVIQFGLGVFVPHENEAPIGRMYLTMGQDGAWVLLPDWVFWKKGRPIKRPRALYPGQQFILLGPDGAFQPPESGPGQPVWFGDQGRIWFNLSEDMIYTFGDEICVSSGVLESRSHDGRTTVFSFADLKAGDAAGASILRVKIEFKTAGDRSKTRDRTGGRSFMGGRTIVPGQTFPQLVLAGIALPRMDTPEMQISCLERWTLWLDESGGIAAELSAKEKRDALPAFSGAGRSGLLFREAGEKSFQEVKTIPFQPAKTRCEVVESPLPQNFHGILLLAHPPFFPLEEGEVRLGRAVAEPDIRLDFLNRSETLQWTKGYDDPEMTLGNIGLSGEHALLLFKDGLARAAITRGRMPVYILDREKKVRRTLMPGSKEDCPLEPGESLIMGCYVLEFRFGPSARR
jgi:hypothetical protein